MIEITNLQEERAMATYIAARNQLRGHDDEERRLPQLQGCTGGLCCV